MSIIVRYIKALKEIDYSNTQRFKVRDEDLGKIFQEQIVRFHNMHLNCWQKILLLLLNFDRTCVEN